MRKLLPSEEGPIDNIIYMGVERIAPVLKALNHTPNMITTYSLLFGLAAPYFLFKGQLLLFAVTTLISYFFDCVDGYYARKYEMTSKFGDLYDHFTDVVTNGLVILVFFIRYYQFITLSSFLYILVPLLIIPFIFMGSYLGCQQKRYDNKDIEESLDIFRLLCPNDEAIHWTRYFSCGTIKLLLVATIVLFERMKSK
jgi:phosphatidylglycerophosphate synthase